MTDPGDHPSFRRWEEEWDEEDVWDLSEEHPTPEGSEVEIRREPTEIEIPSGDEWELTDEQPTYRSDPVFEYEELGFGVSLGDFGAQVSHKVRPDSPLGRAAVLLSIMISTAVGGLAAAGICALASASTATTLAVSFPVFGFIALVGFVVIAMRRWA